MRSADALPSGRKLMHHLNEAGKSIAAAQAALSHIAADLDEARAAVQRVRDLHRPHEFGHCIGCGMAVNHPCPTLAALDGGQS